MTPEGVCVVEGCVCKCGVGVQGGLCGVGVEEGLCGVGVDGGLCV